MVTATLSYSKFESIQLQRKESSGVRRKFSWGGFGWGSYGGHFHLVRAVCDVTIWRHFHVSKTTFWRSLL